MKILIYVKKGLLQGAFTNKKNLWKYISEVEKSPNTLYIKTNKKESELLDYTNFQKGIKERKNLRVYKKSELKKEFKKCKSYMNIWEVESNEQFKLKRKTL